MRGSMYVVSKPAAVSRCIVLSSYSLTNSSQMKTCQCLRYRIQMQMFVAKAIAYAQHHEIRLPSSA